MIARIKNKTGRLNLSYLIAIVSISLISSLYPQDLDNIKIGIVHSSLTKNLLYAEDQNFYPIQDWELFFLNRKISYEVFDDEGLDDYDFDEVDILILPSIEILSDDGFENLQDFLEEGKGLFILGKLGVQDDYGNNRREDLLQSLGGFKVNEFLDRSVIAKNHILYANNFLTHNLQINTSLTVMNNFPLLYIEHTSGKIRQFGEYVTEDGSYDDHLLRKSGIAMIENGKGRILWFGFQLSQISVDDEAELPKIIFNGIDWLAAKPIAWLNPWYLNFNSATVITGNLSEPGDYFFELVMPFAYQSMVTNINCFLKPDAIVSFPAEIEKMPSQRELHILFDETDYLDIPEDDRLKMIENAAGILRNKTNQSLLGIKYLNRSKQSNITDNVLFKHIDFISYEDNSIISFSAGKGSLSGQQEILYPSITSSFNNGVYEMSELADYKKHFDSIHKRGGIIPVVYIDMFSPTSTNMDSETFRKVLSYSRQNYSWVAPYSVIVEWLIEKENISVKLEEIGEKPVIRMVIENRNKDRVENVGIRLTLSPKYRNPETVNRNFNLRYDALTRSYYLLVPFLLANQSTMVEVHYDN